MKCFAKSFATSPPLSPRNRLSLSTLVTSDTLRAAAVTNKSVGAPVFFDFCDKRVCKLGRTERIYQAVPHTGFDIPFIMKETRLSRLLDPVHSVVSVIAVSIESENRTDSDLPKVRTRYTVIIQLQSRQVRKSLCLESRQIVGYFLRGPRCNRFFNCFGRLSEFSSLMAVS